MLYFLTEAWLTRYAAMGLEDTFVLMLKNKGMLAGNAENRRKR